MTSVLESAPTTYYTGRPRYEGANIGTWVGFKQFVYLAEDAVLQYYRDRGQSPASLFHSHGIGLSFVEHSVRLPGPIYVDDLVHAQATLTSSGTFEDTFTVILAVYRDGERVPVLKGRLRVAFVTEHAGGAGPTPEWLTGRVVAGLADLRPPASAPAGPREGFTWSQSIPYPHCHFSDRIQHSGYVRNLEEVVHRYLADQGISIRRMLTERNWIPAVTRSQVRILADAHMEEELLTVFTVDDVIKDVMFAGRMDAYVERSGTLVHTATAAITHGYGVSQGPDAGQVAVIDPETRSALLWAGR
ncbi:thioesterase [Actinoplanes sp. NEAU-A12]|uniref:Thioesterase n=1 Tax=Actinoplanes sandaracinus TaxID=3045177 RepID=A0ABT6WHQ9_9ACTN|nr:thioesterase [Actinoplanes sandaracinus]MDI6099261.1 thioesterase [Actinoplanes sandaracinus]